MGKYDDQAEERPPSNAANPVGSSVPAAMADGRAEDCFSQGATSARVSVRPGGGWSSEKKCVHVCVRLCLLSVSRWVEVVKERRTLQRT